MHWQASGNTQHGNWRFCATMTVLSSRSCARWSTIAAMTAPARACRPRLAHPVLGDRPGICARWLALVRPSPDGARRAIKVNNATVGWSLSPLASGTPDPQHRYQLRSSAAPGQLADRHPLHAASRACHLPAGARPPRPVKGWWKARINWPPGFLHPAWTRALPDGAGQAGAGFNQLASTLEKNQQMRRDFMADISHELRTPLAVLRGELKPFRTCAGFANPWPRCRPEVVR